MTVDVLRATDLPKDTTTFAVVKMGPYWTRLPAWRTAARPRRGSSGCDTSVRARGPMHRGARRGTASSYKFLGRVKLQLSTMEDGVRYAGSFQLMARD